MRKLFVGSVAVAALSFALTGTPALAADATPDQVYAAAKAGHLEEAQQLLDQVLRDHPDSSKAHYIQAELYAREGNPGLARTELNRAEQLKPGLPEIDARSVQELKTELGLIHRGADRPVSPGSGFGAPSSGGVHFPWMPVVVLAVVVLVFWMIFRRRTYTQYNAGAAPMAPGGYGPGGYVGPGGGGYVGGAPGGGIGSSVAGGLAGGLAAGAGIVAGEELAHHFLDGNERERVAAPPPNDDGFNSNANGDMGGNDFGVNDPGSWDDGGSGGGGGGGDGGGGDWS
jgi:hypothetical protein